jgi:membrane protein YqaA with SNARE-associated domain
MQNSTNQTAGSSDTGQNLPSAEIQAKVAYAGREPLSKKSLRTRTSELTQRSVSRLQKFVDRVWYPQLIGLLAALDNLILVIPNDGILISSSMLAPRRWFAFALNIAIGSTVGAILLAAIVELKGLPWILELYPGINSTEMWSWTERFFLDYGLAVVFVVAISPLVQQPAIVLAAMANTPLISLAVTVFVGRFLKFLLMAYVGSHAPNMLKRMWGLRDELQDAGVKLN